MQSARPYEIYQAPDPQLSLTQSQGTIFSNISLAIRKQGAKYFGNRISRYILSSQNMKPVPFKLKDLTDEMLEINQLSVRTHDSAVLETAEFNYKASRQDNQLVVIYVPGAGVLYQKDPDEYINMAKKFKCCVVTFNYRGTGNSSGIPNTEDDLVIDCIAQVNRLIAEGASPEKIVLYSPSLGGAIGAKVAHYFTSRGDNLYHINFKSFSSMTNVITGLVRTLGISGHYEYSFMRLLSYIVKPVVKSILWISGWELDAVGDYAALPNQYKALFLVRSDKNRRAAYG